MKFSLCTSFLLACCLVVLTTGMASACNDSSPGQPSAFSAGEHCSPAADDCLITHPGQDCPPDTDGCGRCHCPACGGIASAFSTGFFKNDGIELPAPVWLFDRRASSFYYKAPFSEVYRTALFQPPRV